MLAGQDPDYAGRQKIKRNLDKRIITRKGKNAARFEPAADMADAEKFIKNLI